MTKKYEGVLSNPYDGDLIADWFGVEKRPLVREFLERREEALFQQFGIERTDDVNAWRDLARALASNHIPAYQKKRGRPAVARHRTRDWAVLFHTLKTQLGNTDETTFDIIAQGLSTVEVPYSAKQISNALRKYQSTDKSGWEEDRRKAEEVCNDDSMPGDPLVWAFNAASLTIVTEAFCKILEREINNWPQSNFPEGWDY